MPTIDAISETRLISQLLTVVKKAEWYLEGPRLFDAAAADASMIKRFMEALEDQPPHSGEWVKIGGRYERVASVLVSPTDGIDGEYRLQLGSNGCGRSYLGEGWTDFSGSLASPITVKLRLSEERREGSMWTFHNNECKAHNGVDFLVSLRVFEVVDEGQ